MHGFKLEEFSTYKLYISTLYEDNTDKISKLKTVLKKALYQELTQRQIQSLKLYYIDDLSQKRISEMLKIDKSCVSRHIKKGKLTLEKFLKYNIYLNQSITN